MKYLSRIFQVSLLLFLCACNTGSDSNDDDDELPILILTDEVEVFEADLLHNNVVLAIENGGQAAYIIDKAGNKLFNWSFDTNLGNDLELLPNGYVIGMFRTDTPDFSFGGYGGVVKIIKPNNDIEWQYEYSSANYIAHHDVEILPNGNVVFLVWEKIDVATAQAAGVNVTHDIYPEKLVEINPANNQIVWEWRSWDHIIQEFDNSKLNYGDVANNPQLVNINYSLVDNGDIMHANGIDHDSTKDVIYISVNFFNEVWVIDHSTTTAEAATAAGGNYNKGGDLLYRFGNPSTYNNTQGDILFDRNHFPNLIEDGKPGEGNMLIFVNGMSVEQSTVFELEMPDSFSLIPNTNNEPSVAWSFTDEELFYGRISGANRLSNGNTLICEGDYGYWEVTPSGLIAWKYNGTGGSYWRGYDYDLDDPALGSLGLSF